MKQTIESTRPREYFMDLMKKKCDGKKLNQREKVFIELYINEELPCFYFVKQMKPAVLQYNSRIFKLREQGFIIKCEWHRVGNEKHSTYTLDKHHVEVEKKNLYEKAFDRLMGFF